MSSRSRKARATLAPPEPPAADDEESMTLDAYVPDYGQRCEVCGQKPCVSGMKDGRVVFESLLCGPCCFGTAEALDPETW